MQIYVVTYSTECGDTGVAGVFDTEPSPGHLSAIALRDFPDHIIEEDGVQRRMIWFGVLPTTLLTLPVPVDPLPSI